MPRRDGSGPSGMGPMTGRGMGACNSSAGRNGSGMCSGYGAGRGRRGQGMSGKSFLKRQKAMLESR